MGYSNYTLIAVTTEMKITRNNYKLKANIKNHDYVEFLEYNILLLYSFVTVRFTRSNEEAEDHRCKI